MGSTVKWRAAEHTHVGCYDIGFDMKSAHLAGRNNHAEKTKQT